MPKEHFVFLVPGLGDKTGVLELATQHWHRFGLQLIFHKMNWRDGEPFDPKLQLLIDHIDQLKTPDNLVSLVGTSAGGSAVGNAFFERRDTVHKVINVCGRLRVGTRRGIHSFDQRTATSPAFAESVRLFGWHQTSLTAAERQRIMTVHPAFGDELVPTETTMLEGANNLVLPSFEHMLSIGLTLSLFSRPLIQFLTCED